MATHDSVPTLRITPLHDEHLALGARMVDFNSWHMPLHYSGIVEEHRAVRTAAGIFDVSHMGELAVEGPGAQDFLDGLVPNNVAKLAEGQALYSQICREDGGTLDDLLIYHPAPGRYMVVVNAGTTDGDWEWFSRHAAGRDDVRLENRSDVTALIAVQGPLALAMLAPLTDTDLAAIAYYHFSSGQVAGITSLISRTGYTGEDGFELYHASADAPALWRAILAAGRSQGLLPAGLGARDTLRLEAGYCLYGHELTEAITPLEADLGWSVRLKKEHDFIGKAALAAQKAQGLRHIRVGLAIGDRAAVARAGSAIFHDGRQVGALTSGTMSLTLGYPIGMGYVPPDLATPGTQLAVEVRGRQVPAEAVAMPFYHRANA